ncbi:MAG: leucine-rich repeat domain-containing protein [Clostridia bacterium]|nr:leucine-rich repeat domain-containing protein [Clostridia bacterium]
MRKKLLITMLILALVCTIFAFAACKDSSPQTPEKPSGSNSVNNKNDSKKPQRHTHSYSDTFSDDENYHWYASDCEHDLIKDKAEHSWDNGVITTPATCTEDGIKTFSCTVCSRTRTESILTTGHAFPSYGMVTADPTCTTDGVKVFKCENCSEKREESIPARHSFKIEWSYDAQYHWREADCGHDVIASKAKHSFTEYGSICTVCNKDLSNGLSIVLNSDMKSYRVIGLKVANQDATKIVIPSEYKGLPVTEIGKISGYSNLQSVEIPSSVKIIDDYAFSSCTNLRNVQISSGVTTFGSFVFSGCTSLTSIVIPKSVTSIANHAFNNCSSLTIYCEAQSKPSGWVSNWNASNRPVVWGYVVSED